MESDTEWIVRPVAPDDAAGWRELYRQYRRFYEMPDDEDALDTVWAWLGDADHEVEGFVAVDERGMLGGLAHVRLFARPLEGDTGLYLDDLFVDPDLRGGGLGRGLLDFVGALAAERELGVVSWMTAPDNTTARALYDSVASATPWITYDMVPGSSAGAGHRPREA